MQGPTYSHIHTNKHLNKSKFPPKDLLITSKAFTLMPWYLEDMICMVFWINGRKHRVVPIVMHKWFLFFETNYCFQKLQRWKLPSKLVTLYPLGNILSPEKKPMTIGPFKPFFLHCSSENSWTQICNAWPTMAVLGHFANFEIDLILQ